DDHGVHVRLDAVGSDGHPVLHGVEIPAVLAAVAAVEAVAVGPLGADVLRLHHVAVLDHVRVQGGGLDDGVLDVALGAGGGDDGVGQEAHESTSSQMLDTSDSTAATKATQATTAIRWLLRFHDSLSATNATISATNISSAPVRARA